MICGLAELEGCVGGHLELPRGGETVSRSSLMRSGGYVKTGLAIADRGRSQR